MDEGLLRDAVRARRVLGHDVADAGPAELETADDVRDWFARRRDDLLDAVGVPDERAADLAAHLWALAPPDDDWCRRLHDRTTALAAVLPPSPRLAAAFRAGAEALRARGDLRLAAAEGGHELAVWRRLDDVENRVGALHSLATTYRAQGRVHRAIGCLDEVLAVYQRHGRPDGFARTLAELGVLMADSGGFDSAVDYLARAERAFRDLGDPLGQAGAAVLLGRVLWRSGDEAAARRRLTRALPALDEEAAAEVRDLLAGTADP